MLEELKIRVLNSNERESIRMALEHYLFCFKGNDKKIWSQKVVLEDMLDGLLWCEKLKTTKGAE